MSVGEALFASAAIVALLAIVWGAWVSGYSRGYDRRSWHRPVTVALALIAAALALAAIWSGVR